MYPAFSEKTKFIVAYEEMDDGKVNYYTGENDPTKYILSYINDGYLIRRSEDDKLIAHISSLHTPESTRILHDDIVQIIVAESIRTKKD